MLTSTVSYCMCKACQQAGLHEMHCEMIVGMSILCIERDVTALMEIMLVLPTSKEIDTRLVYQSK